MAHALLKVSRKLQLDTELKKVRFYESILDCEICILAKMVKLPFKEVRTRAQRPLQTIHTDTMGPIKPISDPGRNKFINVYVDYSKLQKHTH